ncbi:MAG: F0F1 ATP synthase subunit B [Patescibacteria group bacterium]
MNEFSFIQIAYAETESAVVEPDSVAHAEGGGLELNPYTIAFQALNFLILLVLLNMILYKPLVKLLKEREKKIKDGVENAEKAEGMLKESHIIREDMIRSAKSESQAMLEKARLTGEKVKADILGEAHKEADHVIESGHTLIDMEREKAADDFKGLAVNLIIKATEKLLREKLSDQKDTQMIKESLNSMI